ncbi:MAG: sugar ABC transporter permease, partial [Actinobacteria bacterium]|nr:sugar ABC transporter permease [Actinomycetota bacterium]
MKPRAAPYLLVGPASLLLIAFGVLPILVALVVSATDMDAAGLGDLSQVSFIGTANYRALFGDPSFWQALGNTAFYVLLGVPSVVVLSLVAALALNH